MERIEKETRKTVETTMLDIEPLIFVYHGLPYRIVEQNGNRIIGEQISVEECAQVQQIMIKE